MWVVKLFHLDFTFSIFLHLDIPDEIQPFLKYVSKLIHTCLDKAEDDALKQAIQKKTRPSVNYAKDWLWEVSKKLFFRNNS